MADQRTSLDELLAFVKEGAQIIEYGPRATPEELASAPKGAESMMFRRPLLYDSMNDKIHIGKPGEYHDALFKRGLMPTGAMYYGSETIHPEETGVQFYNPQPPQHIKDQIAAHTGLPLLDEGLWTAKVADWHDREEGTYPTLEEPMYHVSPTINRQGIESEGLRQSDVDGVHVWMVDDPDVARQLATKSWGGQSPVDIWQVNTQNVPLEPEPHPGSWYKDNSWVAKQPIEPHRLKRIGASRFSDSWDTREFPDVGSDPLPATHYDHEKDCTCDEGHKLDCPVHGLNADIDQSEKPWSWSIPQVSPVGYPQDQPRAWQTPYTGSWKVSMPVGQMFLKDWIRENGPYLYHHTGEDRIPGILQNGLLPWDHPDNPVGTQYPPEKSRAVPRPDHVYLRQPHRRGETWDPDKGYVQVDLRKLDPYRLNPDEDLFHLNKDLEEQYGHPPQTRYPSEWEDQPWTNRGEWAEYNNFGKDIDETAHSFERTFPTVAYKGVIPPEALSYPFAERTSRTAQHKQWDPGNEGKWAKEKDGKILTWRTYGDGWPHHFDMASPANLAHVGEISAAGILDPQGSEPNTSLGVLEEVARTHPALRSPEDWSPFSFFGSLAEEAPKDDDDKEEKISHVWNISEGKHNVKAALNPSQMPLGWPWEIGTPVEDMLLGREGTIRDLNEPQMKAYVQWEGPGLNGSWTNATSLQPRIA